MNTEWEQKDKQIKLNKEQADKLNGSSAGKTKNLSKEDELKNKKSPKTKRRK